MANALRMIMRVRVARLNRRDEGAGRFKIRSPKLLTKHVEGVIQLGPVTECTSQHRRGPCRSLFRAVRLWRGMAWLGAGCVPVIGRATVLRNSIR
ncbi:MAG: hypothetical protein DHS20C16_25690 [Phycisphaerae bacterium]|nr:MAG: hypothetical protein DHS20C16_25690 [Phycisphaerae bacterium]